jgi:catechol 2,3-dioxygenase-like lactoylglutathione lyase family enzyme
LAWFGIKGGIMAKLRHIALSVEDPWATAQFYMDAFGMKKVGEVDISFVFGVYLSDGVMNMAILKFKNDEMAGPRGKDWVGIHHLGFWVDDIKKAAEQLTAAGGVYFSGEPREDNAFYEVKYTDPNGVMVDITANGWGGASKEGVPDDSGAKLTRPDLQADRSQLKAAGAH